MKSIVVALLATLALAGCQQGPPPPSTPEQQRYMMGCRPVDAASDPVAFEAYCDEF